MQYYKNFMFSPLTRIKKKKNENHPDRCETDQARYKGYHNK